MNEEFVWRGRNDIVNPPNKTDMPEYYVFMPAGSYEIQPSRDLRLLKKRSRPNCWIAVFNGWMEDKDSIKEEIPGNLSEEDAKALAIAMWRMR
jgi:hypothetical protein